jgi:4-amino-4-deoxy-L-arabinose transferase-like glycosyltransferase
MKSYHVIPDDVITVAKALAILVFLFVGCYMLLAQITSYILKNNLHSFRGLSLIFFQIISLIIGIYVLNKVTEKLERNVFLSTGMIICILVAITVIPRIFLILNVSIEQTSDYHTYWINSLSLVNEYKFSTFWQQYFGAIASNMPFICTVFAAGLKIFGPNLQALLCLNILYYSIAVLALFFIASYFLSRNYAFLCALLFALWPNNILDSLYLATEPIYICFLLSGFAVLLYGLRYRGKKLWWSAAIAGILLSISQGLRPLTTVLMIALSILMLGYYKYIDVRNKLDLSFQKRTLVLAVTDKLKWTENNK